MTKRVVGCSRHRALNLTSIAVAIAVVVGPVVTASAQDRNDRTLHEAAGRGDRAAVLRLLDRGADINARDGRGRTPLHAAARSCLWVGEATCRGVVGALLDRGADVDARDAAGRTPLHGAAGGHVPGVGVELIRRGADVEARDDDGRTPLHVAAQYGGTFGGRQVAVELLERGADADARDAEGTTPRQVAEGRGWTEFVRLLRRWREAGSATTRGRGTDPDLEVTVSSVMRFFGPIAFDEPDPEDLAYIEAVVSGPFFERGRNEELTIRLVPDLAPGLHENNWPWWFREGPLRLVSADPWGALQRFAGGTIEFHRGGRRLGGISDRRGWIRVDGVSYSPQTGLLNLHFQHANVGSAPGAHEVARYDPMTGRMEVLHFPSVGDGFGELLMTCTGEQSPWPAPPAIGRTVFFRPCRSNVERVRRLYAAADVRALGNRVVARTMAAELGATTDRDNLTLHEAADVEAAEGGEAEVRVEVTAASVMRFFGPIPWSSPEPEDLAYVEATLFGPFFERGWSEELTVRLVPDRGRWGPLGDGDQWNWLWWSPVDDDGKLYGLADPRRALRRFSRGATELYRGSRLAARVGNSSAWVEMVGVPYSPQTGLLELHVYHVGGGNAPGDYQVFRYDPIPGKLEVLHFGPVHEGFGEGFGELFMTCTGGQQRWPAASAMGRTVSFEPCRSNVERAQAVYAAAAEVRGWGGGVVTDGIATQPGAAVDVACDACAGIDDETLSAGLATLRRLADGLVPGSVSVDRFASAAFELVAVRYLAPGDPRPPYTLLLVRRPDGPWRPIYGWEMDGYRPPSGRVQGFAPGADSVVRLTIGADYFPTREAFLDIRARTLRVAHTP